MKNFIQIGGGLILGFVICKLLKRKLEKEYGEALAKYLIENDDARKELIKTLLCVDKGIEKSKKRRLFL